jgi:hypothetical protein
MNVFLQKQNYKYFNLETYEFVIYSVLSFFLPFVISHPQWLIGILVNFFLIRSAIHFRFKYVLPLLILPSLGVLFSGMIFGSNTFYLIYYLPFIWISNLIFILSYRYFTKNKFLTSFYSSLIKFIFLFIVTLIFVFIFNFPKMFFVNMGYLQFITAIIGSVIATLSSKLI